MRLDWDKISPHTRAEDSPGFLLWRLSNRWQRTIKATLKPHDLTHVQFVLLACLAWLESQAKGQPITQSAIASQAGTDPMMTSQVLRALIGLKLVERKPHPTDSRAFAVALSMAGKTRIELALPEVEFADRKFFAENETEFDQLSMARKPDQG